MINRSELKMTLAAKPDCLSLAELERLAEGSSAQHPHLANCLRCQTELALLKEFEESTPLPDEGAAVAWISARMEQRLDQIKKSKGGSYQRETVRGGWFNRLFGAGSARWLVPAAAVVIVAAGVILLSSRQRPELHADLGSGPTVYRSQQVEVLAPRGDLSEAPTTLHWRAFAGASSYRVLVMEVDKAPVWSSATEDISLTIPDSTRAKMLPGKPVLWQVTALDSQGRVLAVSQLERFLVKRKASVSNSE